MFLFIDCYRYIIGQTQCIVLYKATNDPKWSQPPYNSHQLAAFFSWRTSIQTWPLLPGMLQMPSWPQWWSQPFAHGSWCTISGGDPWGTFGGWEMGRGPPGQTSFHLKNPKPWSNPQIYWVTIVPFSIDHVSQKPFLFSMMCLSCLPQTNNSLYISLPYFHAL